MTSERKELSTLLLSNTDVEKLVTFKEVIDSVEKTWGEAALGRVVNPTKLTLDLGESGSWPEYDAYMNAMPAYIGWLDSAGLKWAGGFWNNNSKGLPSISALILLVEPKTGMFKAVVEGSLITALRTAAQSVVGIKYLAKKDFKSVGIYGAGTQAKYHSLMISKYFPSSEIKIFDVRPESTQNLIREILKETGAHIIGCSNPEECSESDVIITVTTSRKPFLKAEWLRKGQLIAALGSYQEVYSEAIMKASKVVVDNIQQASHRGALKILSEEGGMIKEKDYVTIGEIVAGLKLGRGNSDDIIFFEPIGTGMLDVVIATIVYNRAIKKGIGKGFEFLKL
jgi:alanine dehydrogenase